MSGTCRMVAAHNPRDRERVLWVNVVLQAIRDATEAKSTHNPNRTRAEARAWFTLTNPDFIETCHCAHLDPDATYQRAMQAIARYDAAQTPGVASDFKPSKGTSAGSTAQETPEISFPEKAEA